MNQATIETQIIKLIHTLSFARSTDKVMAAVKNVVRNVIGADGVTFVLREGENCFYADEDAIAPLWKGRRFPMSVCISGWVIQNRKSVAIEDIYSDPRIPADAYRATFVKSLAMVPVRVEDPIAAIGAYWSHHHLASDEDLFWLQMIADSAAVAIENIQLYDILENSLNRERKARAEADAANRVKDDFLDTISHELRTPLTPMLAWAQLLTPESNKETLKRGLKAISESADAQARVVSNLLDFTQLYQRKLELDLKPVNLRLPVEAALASIAPLASRKGVELRANLEQDVVAAADAARFEQIARNLLANAVKFSKSPAAVDVILLRTDAEAQLIVSDSGEGIAPEFLPRLFLKFEQWDGSRNRKHGGLGLGLAISKQLVDLHGGRISAYSEGTGKGATFKVALPILR